MWNKPMPTTHHVDISTNVSGLPMKSNGQTLFSAAYKNEARRARAWLKDRVEKSKKLPAGELLFEAAEATPTLAELVLTEFNDGNRPPRKNRIHQYAGSMKTGDWRFNASPVSFSRNGTLIDGQHRLGAVAESGCSVRMVFAFGEDSDVFMVKDTGATRGGSDSLSIAGYENTAILAASARLLKIVTGSQPRGNTTISNQEILEIVRKHPDLQAATSYGGRIGKIKGTTTSAPTVALYLISKGRFADRAEAFVDLLVHGNLSKKRDPILILRDGLIKRTLIQQRGGAGMQSYVCASIILAWNLWVRGRTASPAHLVWVPGEPFPIPE